MTRADEITMRVASPGDHATVCRLNQKLKDDEGARARLPWEDLVARLRGWLRDEGYEAVLFERGGDPVAYIIFRREPDPCVSGGEMIYIRQFYVEREFRLRGIGRSAIVKWRAEFVPDGMHIEMDVLETNPGGRAFWEAIGFRPRMTRMRMERAPSNRTKQPGGSS